MMMSNNRDYRIRKADCGKDVCTGGGMQFHPLEFTC